MKKIKLLLLCLTFFSCTSMLDKKLMDKDSDKHLNKICKKYETHCDEIRREYLLFLMQIERGKDGRRMILLRYKKRPEDVTFRDILKPIQEKVRIGDKVNGGIVFYLDGKGGGLVCAEFDQSKGAKWGCSGKTIVGTRKGIGTGADNSALILMSCAETSIAAKICHTLVLNGYSDWFLPSKDELNLMYQNLKLNGIGGFSASLYWSSSGVSSTTAVTQGFYEGSQYYYSKNFDAHVRAVRAF